MDGLRNPSSNAAVGFRLLPSELIQDILTRLTLPDLLRLKCLSKSITSVVSTDFFRRDFNLRSRSDTWLFVYQKRSLRDSLLYGFTPRSSRWFKIPVLKFLSPVIPPGEDLYFLTAAAGFFLFASNNCRQLIVLDLTVNAVTKIPPSPLGPRDTSSLRRSGFKLIPGPLNSGRFWFMFAEFHENRPVLFVYSSETNTWRSHEAEESSSINENNPKLPREQSVFLSVVHRRTDSVILATRPDNISPRILRPRCDGGAIEVGFSTIGNEVGRLHLYGDGCMVVVRSEGVGAGGMRVFGCIEVWGLCEDGRGWAFMSKVGEGLLDKVKKPYNAMTGCLEEREGHVRVVLVTNSERGWDLIWLDYEVKGGTWSWVPLPQFMSKGLNMAGIALSSGLTL